MINHKKNISYRFEFRMSLKDVKNLTNRITNLFRRDHFIYIKNSDLQTNALKNFENMINIIETMPKAIINIGQFMLLETLMISGFLRGDYFLMPLSTCNLRIIEKNFWRYNRDVICDKEYFEFIQNDDNLLVFEEFYKTIKTLNDFDRDVISYILELKDIFSSSVLLYEEI